MVSYTNCNGRANNNLLIFIEGSINVGKGVFINGLARALETYSTDIHIHVRTPGDGVFETDININDMFHMDPSRWAAEFLIHNLSEKLKFMKERCISTNSIIIIERSIATESAVFIKSLYDCDMISIVTYNSCISLVTQISEMFEIMQQITQTLTYIYMRTDPTDLYESLISHGMYDCLNYKLLLAIHNNYENFINVVSNDNSGNKYVVCVDVSFDQIFKPGANLVKVALKRLQTIYPALQKEPGIQS